MSDGGATFRVAVLASGTGSNLQAIIDSVHGRQQGGGPTIEIVLVASDKPGCLALERARDAGIATAVFPNGDHLDPATGEPDRAARDRAMADALQETKADLVVLAGYMQILSAEFVRAFDGRLINVHPSLLPKYPGLDAIGQALDAQELETGVTVHFVDEGVDTGPVIAQQRLAIEPGDTHETLATRVHAIEHVLLPRVIRELATDRARSGA